jgi:hypothetical protein
MTDDQIEPYEGAWNQTRAARAPATMDGERPEGPAEGTERATGGVISADAALAQIGERGCDLELPQVTPASMFSTLVKVVGERDELRRKVEAVRALHTPFETPTRYGLPARVQCDYCVRLCHSGSGLHCDEPYDAEWPCDTIKALDGEG